MLELPAVLDYLPTVRAGTARRRGARCCGPAARCPAVGGVRARLCRLGGGDCCVGACWICGFCLRCPAVGDFTHAPLPQCGRLPP